MLRQLSRLGFKPFSSKRIISKNAFTVLQHQRFEFSGTLVNLSQKNFRQVGIEKDAGALQDLLRRVMEVDADITKTPVAGFSPKTQSCIAYCLADEFSLEVISRKFPFGEYVVTNTYDDMLHISNTVLGGDIHMFNNGIVSFWGFDQTNQDKFLNNFRKHENAVCFTEAKETAEYAIDEDEVTDMKGDVMILNPHIPPINLSKIAFSYGLGRAAKLNSIEHSLKDYLAEINGIPDDFCNAECTDGRLSNRLLTGKLLCIQQRMVKGSRDGLLGTSDFHWARPELKGYVDKISARFDVAARIAILNKLIEYAKSVINAAKDHDLLK
ncbi:hypothetical protein BD408DRAFT_424576 [Parasitella parasitica]|nr:hypothetical protein BD408DRAFT_424576 [Parasitella parasitica]